MAAEDEVGAFTHRTHRVNGMDIHAAHLGPPDAPVLLMLHGFPEYWAAWADVARSPVGRLAETHHCILPDQRGYGHSSKPPAVEDYDTRHLAADMAALIDTVSPDRPVALAGHDWGASVAYALAFRQPERVSRLVIANGVHPMTFQRALFADGPQRAASQYIHILRDPASDARLSEDGHRRTFNMLERFSAAPWLTAARRAAYAAAWEGALPTMLHWYRASPLTVPRPGDPAQPMSFTAQMRERYRVAMPHLVVWGTADTALLPEAREGLEEFCDDLGVREIDGASHWLLHERPDAVAGAMRDFLA